jgi:hypothetical protein
MKKCSICKKEMWKVIYAGFPMWLCSNEDCNCVEGFWSFFIELIDPIIPFNGMFYRYRGFYIQALIAWLTT